MKKKSLGKKEVKTYVNKNGFYFPFKLQKNAVAPKGVTVPEGATYFEGIASDGELNRNGYIIRGQALMDSAPSYMTNPIILLGHDPDCPVGNATDVQPNGKDAKNGVKISGYIFDDMTDGAFGRDLLKGISTGAIPTAYEFQNTKTGEVLSVEQFQELREEQGYFGDWEQDWTIAVTAVDWVENSLTTLPSNRKALVTQKNAIEAFFSGEKFCEDSLRKFSKMDEAKMQACSCDNCDCSDCAKCECDDCMCKTCDCVNKNSIKKNEAEETTEVKKEEEKTEEKPAEETKDEKPEETTTTESEKPKEGESKEAETTGEKPEASETTGEKSGETETATADTTEAKTDKIKISLADRNRLKAAAELLTKTLEATVAEGEEEQKPDAPKEEAKPAENAEETKSGKPAEEVKPDAENAGGKTLDGEEGEVENMLKTDEKIDVHPEVKNVILTLVSLNTVLEKENKENKALLAKVPNKKGFIINSQFNQEKPEDKKPSKGEALLSFLRGNGFNV